MGVVAPKFRHEVLSHDNHVSPCASLALLSTLHVLALDRHVIGVNNLVKAGYEVNPEAAQSVYDYSAEQIEVQNNFVGD